MTKGKRPAAAKGRAAKLKLKKETIRDLDAKGTGKNVKGGSLVTCVTCAAGQICGPTQVCRSIPAYVTCVCLKNG